MNPHDGRVQAFYAADKGLEALLAYLAARGVIPSGSMLGLFGNGILRVFSWLTNLTKGTPMTDQTTASSPIADVIEVKHFAEILGLAAVAVAEGSHSPLSLFAALEPVVSEIPTVIAALHKAKAELPLVPAYFDQLAANLPAELNLQNSKAIVVVNEVISMFKSSFNIAQTVGVVHAPVAP